MADLIRGDVALPLDHFGEIPTATVLRRGQRLARQGFAARNDIETPLGAATAGYILGLSGRRMTDEFRNILASRDGDAHPTPRLRLQSDRGEHREYPGSRAPRRL